MMNIGDLIKSTTEVFYKQDSRKLENVWVSYQKAMEGSMTVGGDNKYKLSHMGKQKLLREGRGVINIVCNHDFMDKCKKQLEQGQNISPN